MKTEEVWEQQAENWVRWARTPRHDSYWYFSPSFFEAIVPPAGRLTLEVGCGEGRVARDLAARGHRMLALDSSSTMIRHAQAAGGEGVSYLLGNAQSLPFGDQAFDLVVSYNSLMDVDDMPAAIAEMGRVLTPGGQLCACVTHPFADAGSFESKDEDAPFTITGSYFGRRRFHERWERDGLEMTFSSWCYPLEDYARALEAAGFLIERLREPAARPEQALERPSLARWRRLPNFLFLRCLKGGPPH